ncbi:envelope-like protein [Trifolium medium]|uniref:Envelope-like protein n=1 Tax=Trifolium medium TaxID=97028 RepID=A0A392M5W1_9FABA|nr:envelope-like protein [Trifolium medium]
MKHADTFAIKGPIAFPCLITEIILSQHPDILQPGEAQTKKPAPLTFDYMLFVGKHVPDIVIPKAQDVAGTSASVTKATKNEVLAKLMEISKALGETIKISTLRKMNVDKLIESMTKEQEAEEGDKEDEDEAGEGNNEDAGNDEINPKD